MIPTQTSILTLLVAAVEEGAGCVPGYRPVTLCWVAVGGLCGDSSRRNLVWREVEVCCPAAGACAQTHPARGWGTRPWAASPSPRRAWWSRRSRTSHRRSWGRTAGSGLWWSSGNGRRYEQLLKSHVWTNKRFCPSWRGQVSAMQTYLRHQLQDDFDAFNHTFWLSSHQDNSVSGVWTALLEQLDGGLGVLSTDTSQSYTFLD